VDRNTPPKFIVTRVKRAAKERTTC